MTNCNFCYLPAIIEDSYDGNHKDCLAERDRRVRDKICIICGTKDTVGLKLTCGDCNAGMYFEKYPSGSSS